MNSVSDFSLYHSKTIRKIFESNNYRQRMFYNFIRPLQSYRQADMWERYLDFGKAFPTRILLILTLV